MAKRVAIKRGDQVYVIAGKDRGKSGRVMRVYPQAGKVLVEGVNQIKKAVKANPGKNVKGGIVEREAPLAISNVSLICPETNAPTRVGFKFLEDGSKVRVARKSGAIMD
jgi:large subunit ribosomal protein L24